MRVRHLEVEEGLGQVVGVLVVLLPRAAGTRLGRPAADARLPPALLRLCLGKPCCHMPSLQLSMPHLYLYGVLEPRFDSGSEQSASANQMAVWKSKTGPVGSVSGDQGRDNATAKGSYLGSLAVRMI